MGHKFQYNLQMPIHLTWGPQDHRVSKSYYTPAMRHFLLNILYYVLYM